MNGGRFHTWHLCYNRLICNILSWFAAIGTRNGPNHFEDWPEESRISKINASWTLFRFFYPSPNTTQPTTMVVYSLRLYVWNVMRWVSCWYGRATNVTLNRNSDARTVQLLFWMKSYGICFGLNSNYMNLYVIPKEEFIWNEAVKKIVFNKKLNKRNWINSPIP